MKIFVKLGGRLSQKRNMSHDGHIVYSQIVFLHSNHQYANRIQKDLKYSIAERKFFDHLRSSTKLKLIAETHTRCVDHDCNLEVAWFFRVLKPYIALSDEVWFEIFQPMTDMLRNHLYLNQFSIMVSRVGGFTFEVENAGSIKIRNSVLRIWNNQVQKNLFFFADFLGHL